MPFVFFILLILLIAQIGFWHTLGAVLGAALMFVLFIPLLIAVVVIGGLLVLAGFRAGRHPATPLPATSGVIEARGGIALNAGQRIRTQGSFPMADHGTVELGTATGADYADHRNTYLGLPQPRSSGAAGGIVVLLVLMAIFLL